jgi:transposase
MRHLLRRSDIPSGVEQTAKLYLICGRNDTCFASHSGTPVRATGVAPLRSRGTERQVRANRSRVASGLEPRRKEELAARTAAASWSAPDVKDMQRLAAPFLPKTLQLFVNAVRNNLPQLIQALHPCLPVADLCRREGIHPTIYYKWLKDFMEAGKGRLRGDVKREATSNEVKDLRQENERLKLLVADLSLENLTLKKSQY